ncbi:SMI1 / KNR4 family protein [Gemmata obscuriglobus]|nr:SMI1 / KNR4 family protein [Gemmata obscuriglobus]VTS08919.1 Uncharacterized protein OS=Pontibacillus halophilus JSM 076056 = DSM 19796 GN=N781_16000 PE=4 SV=1: SMI1_KNR4 [Gemmata obscuriglobus UQM 2246]
MFGRRRARLRMPTFSRSYGPVSAAVVNAAEKRLGVRLPADYKRFLRTINGGCPDPQEFVVPNRGPALAAIFYGVRSERTHADLEYEQEQATLWDPLPPGFLAIGHDPGGNTFLLATFAPDAGRVFFWDRNGLWVREDGRNAFPVADTFTAFMESLHESPQDAEPGAAPDTAI